MTVDPKRTIAEAFLVVHGGKAYSPSSRGCYAALKSAVLKGISPNVAVLLFTKRQKNHGGG
jgi:hypothetical protein